MLCLVFAAFSLRATAMNGGMGDMATGQSIYQAVNGQAWSWNGDGRALSGDERSQATGQAAVGIATIGFGVRSLAKGGVSAYEVGTYDALRARSLTGDALDIHHVGQAQPFEQLIPGYSRATAPAIALREAEHALIPTIRGTTTMTPRGILANDIRNLRNLTEAPNNSLQKLINLNKQMYPNAFQK